MRALRVAQGQLNVIVGDFRENMRRILECVEEAKSVAADIIIFPEHALCGYPPEDLLLRPRFLKDNLRALEVLAARCHGITVLVGFPDSKEGRVYNAAAIIADGAVVGIYHKIELPNYGVFDEKRYFYPGSSCLIL